MRRQSGFKFWFLVPLIIFIGLVIMLFFRLGKPTDIVPTKAINRAVPVFSLPKLSNISTTVSNDDLPKQPFLLNVWGSWCPTCIVEHPFLLELDAQGVDIVGVNYQDELADATAYLKQHGDPFVWSAQDYNGSLAIDLGLTGAPETFIVDGNGYIRQHLVGELNQDNWKSRIEPCMQALQDTSASSQSVIDSLCQ